MPSLRIPGDNHEHLRVHAPRPPLRVDGELRCDRFPREVARHLAGQVGPLANLRSAAGCAVGWRSDAPWCRVELVRLRHLQPAATRIAVEIRADDGGWRRVDSPDLRSESGDVAIEIPLGGERGGELRECWLRLPNISTCLLGGIVLPEGSRVDDPPPAPEPTWCALGDSFTQGFCAASPCDTFVHRHARRRGLDYWNLGLAGLTIEPEVFAWALERRWDLITVGLGSNHAFTGDDDATVRARAAAMCELLARTDHGRIVWMLPPWKACEDGKGPPEFMGVPLDRAAGARAARIRDLLAEVLAEHRDRIDVVGDLIPHDHTLLPDGLHLTARGFALFEEAFGKAVGCRR